MEKSQFVYFQPNGINPKYCERGILMPNDPDYVWYIDEPCKILISEVKIIPNENVIYDRKKNLCLIIKK